MGLGLGQFPPFARGPGMHSRAMALSKVDSERRSPSRDSVRDRVRARGIIWPTIRLMR